MISETDTKAKWAQQYVDELGFSLIPLHWIRKGKCSCGKDCHSAGKHPIGRLAPHGLKDASSDPAVVREWWTKCPDANIGCLTGDSFWALDLDGAEGIQQFTDMLDKHESIPFGPMAATGGAGEHWLFSYHTDPVKSRSLKGYSIDTRGDGGYIVLPPSNHISGGEYRWHRSPLNYPLGPAPGWLMELVSGNGDPRKLTDLLDKPTFDTAKPVSHPGRHDTIRELVCRHLAMGDDPADVRRRAHEFARDKTAAGKPGVGGREGKPVTTKEVDDICDWAEAKQTAGDSARAAGMDQAANWTIVSEWPRPIGPAGYHGILGDIVRMLEPGTEADTNGLLLQLLAAVGNMVGRSPYFLVEGTAHHLNLFVLQAGLTSKGRKGTSWGRVAQMLDFGPDPARPLALPWSETAVVSGLSSGEGLVHDISKDPHGEIRRFVIEEEYARLLRAMGREHNTLSAILRQAWDGKPLRVMVKKDPERCDQHHISLVGHVTIHELQVELSDTSIANGFGNRNLVCCVQRSKILPHGGKLDTSRVKQLRVELATTINVASQLGRLTRDSAADDFWATIYPALSEGRPGLLGAITGRAEAQVMRLASVFAAMDGVATITVDHLRAGNEVWRYCADSCRYIWGTELGDKVADEVLYLCRAAYPDGITRTDISNAFNRNQTSSRIAKALAVLQQQHLVRCAKELPAGKKGRVIERWFAV